MGTSQEKTKRFSCRFAACRLNHCAGANGKDYRNGYQFRGWNAHAGRFSCC